MVRNLVLSLSLILLSACAMRGQTRLSTPVTMLPKADSSAAGILLFPNSVATVNCIAANYASCDPITMQNGTNAEGLKIIAQDGTVSMSTESHLPIADNTSIMGDGTHRWLAMDAVAFIARAASGASYGCQVLGTGINCINSGITTTFNVTQSTGQILSNVLAGSGTRPICTDGSGNITTTSCTSMTNPMTTTGDIIYSSSGSTPARLGIGTTGVDCLYASGTPVWAQCGADPVWTNYTPSVSSSSGSVTTASVAGQYVQSGKTIKVRVLWEGSVSTTASYLTFSYPVTPASFQTLATSIFSGGAPLASGTLMSSAVSGIRVISDATFPGSTTFSVLMNGVYEAN